MRVIRCRKFRCERASAGLDWEKRSSRLTLVRLLSGVNPQVLRQGRAVGERLLTHPALVRPLARVSAHERHHRGTLREAGRAHGTPKGLLAAVRAQVRGHNGGLREGLRAHLTAVRLFAGVRAQVGLERARTGVCLPADAAQVHLGATAHDARLAAPCPHGAE